MKITSKKQIIMMYVFTSDFNFVSGLVYGSLSRTADY